MSDRDVSFVASGQIPPSAPPPSTTGVQGWLKENLFDGWVNSLLTVLCLLFIAWLVPQVIQWAFIDAIWAAGSLKECRAVNAVPALLDFAQSNGVSINMAAYGEIAGSMNQEAFLRNALGEAADNVAVAHGACWAVIVERFDQFIYGFYPETFPNYERWRPNVAFLLMLVAIAYVLFDKMPLRRFGLVFAALFPLLGYFLIWGGSIWGPLLMLAALPVAYAVYKVIIRFTDAIFAVAGAGLAAALWLLFVVAPGDEAITRAIGDSRYDGRIAEVETFLGSDIEAFVRDGAADELAGIEANVESTAIRLGATPEDARAEAEAASAAKLKDYVDRARSGAENELENLRALPERMERLDKLGPEIDALTDTLPSDLIGLESVDDLADVDTVIDDATRERFAAYVTLKSERDELESRTWFTYETLGRVGLEPVESRSIGGFLIAIIIGVTGIVMSLPIGILLALGRRSSMVFIQTICITFIECMRGVPLITLLFVASSVLSYFFPPGSNLDLILRVVIMVTLFASAYMAEVIRGGLAALPQGQYEAADSLGLDYAKSMQLIILPQALKISIPNIVSTFIGLFKDTTLVVVIGLLDPIGLINTTRADSAWNGLIWEFYVFVGFVFFLACFGMSRYSMYLERKLKTDR